MYVKRAFCSGICLMVMFLALTMLVPAGLSAQTVFSDSCSISGSDQNATATIGTTISYDLYMVHTDSILGLVEIATNGTKLPMTCSSTGITNLWHLNTTYRIVEGNENYWKTPAKYYYIASGTAAGTYTPTSYVNIDNMRPKTDGSSMTVTIIGSTTSEPWSTGKYINKGTKIKFSQRMDPLAYQATPTAEAAEINLSPLNGPTGYALTASNPHVSMEYAVPDNLDKNAVISFTARDPYGNTFSNPTIITLPVDTTSPVISQATISPSNPLANDLVTLSVQLAAYDNDTITASCTLLSSNSIALSRVTDTPNFTYTLPLPSSPPKAPYNGIASCVFFVKDKADNIASTTVFFQMNNMLPNMRSLPLASLTQVVEKRSDSIGIIGDFLTFAATATFNPDQDAHLTVDLSTIGGPSALEVPSVSIPTNSFLLNYKILSGNSEDSIARRFVVTARDDNSNNVLATWTTPPIYIDNLPPTFHGVATVTRVVGSGTSYRIGDEFKIKVEVASLAGSELGAVTVDLASISTAYSTYTPLYRASPDSETYEGVFTVGNFLLAGDGVDGIVNFRILASDSQGNVASIAVTSELPIDNQFPEIKFATAVWENEYVKASDTLEFRVKIATGHNDISSVKIDLQPLYGYATTPEMIASSVANLFYYRINEVPVGEHKFVSKSFNAIIKDDNGNSATPSITVPFNTAPTVKSIQVASARGSKILYGDFASVTAIVENVHPSYGTVTIDLSRFGTFGTEEPMEWLGGNTWRKQFIASNSATADRIDQTNWMFSIKASAIGDGKSYSVSSYSAGILVDTERPELEKFSFSPASSTIGTVLNLSVKLASSSSQPHDSESVTIDLTSAGDIVRSMNFTGNGSFTTTLTVATGTLNAGATFPVTVSDNDGNIITSNITIQKFDNCPPSTGTISLDVSLKPWAQDLTGASFINLNKNIIFRMPYIAAEPDDNSTATIDLSLIGLSSTATMTQLNGSYSLSIAAATLSANLENSAHLFKVTVVDTNLNKVTAYTSEYQVDCHPPRISAASATFNSETTGTLTVGLNLDISVQVLDNESQVPTLDLSTISGPSAIVMEQKPDTTDWFIYSYKLPAGSFKGNASWVVTLKDDAQNKVSTFTNVLKVDMRPLPPTFSNSKSWISITNDDNPISTMANANDQISFTLNIQKQTDLIATQTYIELASQATPFTVIATAQLSLLTAPDLYLATFTVPDKDGWGPINGATMSFRIYTKDIFENVSSATASASFGIDNVPPVIKGQNWTVSPNVASVTLDGSSIINVGSGTVVDLMWASATIDTPLSSAYMNISAFPGAPATVSVNFFENSGLGVASVASGISFANYDMTNWMIGTVTLKLTDLGGNYAIASKSFYLDNKRPEINSVTFDGATVSVSVSETISSVGTGKWELWGSTTAGISTYTSLSTNRWNSDSNSIEFTIDNASRAVMAIWASQPIYLKVKNESSPAMNDYAGNWGYAHSALAVTITDSRWREAPALTSMSVLQAWSYPNSTFTIDLVFSKQMDPSSLVASHGVVFTQAADFSSIDYQSGYVFQQANQQSAQWFDGDTRLRLEVTGIGADMLARKLSSGTATLKFATRGQQFCRDVYGKTVVSVTTSLPLSAAVSRPYTGMSPLSFNIENNSGSQPAIDLGNGTFKLSFSDRVLLFTDGFKAQDSNAPVITYESPSSGKRATAFHGNIELHDVNASPATYTVLNFDALKTENNPQISSTTVTLSLTDTDRNNILALFRNNPTPNWRINIKSGAFHNWWGQPNLQYFPAEPGAVTVSTFTPLLPSLAACSISDLPPVKNYSADGLTFEFEIKPVYFGSVVIPITSAAPKARIASQSGEHLATGTFMGWSTRTVDNETRYVATFKNSQSFSGTLVNNASIAAKLEIFNVTDALGNSMGTGVSSMPYDLNAKSDTSPTGFSTASAAFIIDMKSPAVTSVPLNRAIMQASAGAASLTVIFNESMNQSESLVPTLSLATSSSGLSYTISYRFSEWQSPTTAKFLNDTAIDRNLPQGTWTANVNAWDVAENALDTATKPALLIRTQGPSVDSWKILSRQPETASSTSEVLENKPFSGTAEPGAATLSVKFLDAPREPVYLQFTDSDTVIASFVLNVVSSKYATFTWDAASPTSTVLPFSEPSKSYQIQLCDSDNNLNSEKLTWARDDYPPQVSLVSVSGGVNSGTSSSGWFNPALHSNISLNWTVTSESDSPLLRVRDTNGTYATDTFTMTAASSQWNAKYYGKREDGKSVADGEYILDVVDSAGNEGIPNGSVISSFVINIDTVAPAVTSYTPVLNGLTRYRFNPNFATLTVVLDTTETLSASSVWQIEIRTDSNSSTLIATAPIQASNSSLIAVWNGKKSNGSIAAEGYYRIYATDYTGNRSTTYLRIYLSTTEFQVLSATQTASRSVEIRLGQEIDTSLVPASSAFAISPAGPLVASITMNTTSINLIFDRGLTEGQNSITINQTSIRSIEGASLATGKNSASFQADSTPPVISGISFEGLTYQNQVMVTFNENITIPSGDMNSVFVLSASGSAISVNSATLQDDSLSVLLVAGENLDEKHQYILGVQGVTDWIGNKTTTSLASATFKGPDRTPPEMKLAAFSNPAGEYDLLLVAQTNETLRQSPTVQINQSGASTKSFVMSSGSTASTYVSGTHLSNTATGYGTAVVTGYDAAGNAASATVSFTIASVQANVLAQMLSPDGSCEVTFKPGTFRQDTFVKLIPQKLSLITSSSEMKAAIRSSVASAGSLVSADTVTPEISATQSELIPISDGYEVCFQSDKLKNHFEISGKSTVMPFATATALFRYDESGAWRFVARRTYKGWHSGLTDQPGLYAVMLDSAAPRFNVPGISATNLTFDIDKPQFLGTVSDLGSGLDKNSLMANLNGFDEKITDINENGFFRYIPSRPLISGEHELIFKASDMTGNLTQSQSVKFSINVPLTISEIINYPNPARNFVAIRVSTNRSDISDDLLKIKIYDVAGKRVREMDDLRMLRENSSLGSRYLFESRWDLRNDDGRNVANGIYIAKVELRDPDNSEKITRKTHKIAVLR
ncbi:MAG: hypothetical protein HQM10_23450 [Candidatus Riflebacteria bacterium]|nr:hypothetical protein [Candidatus Riflebacteria bacterium]